MKIVLALLLSALAIPMSAQDHLRAGESIHGFPNWAERVLLQWMNRARVDPQKELAGCGSACAEAPCYKPTFPLVWSEGLNRSARFHSDEMRRQRYFAHDSKCALVRNIAALYPVACDGAESCACTQGAPTPWAVRVAFFGEGPSGEIIAGASEPNAAFYLWLYETSASPSCGFGIGNGHRFLILGSSTAVGVGMSGYAVADFGGGGPPYPIPSAAHYPRQADSVALWANWYDTAAPKAANAVVDGKCTPMTLDRGTPENGAWIANANGVGSGCHRYYFSFIDSTGREVTYPVTGSLGIGDASCDDWNTTRLTAKCGTTSNPPPHRPSRRRAVRGR